MSILVVGASGATGRLLVEQLLNAGESVKAIVRSTQSLPAQLIQHNKLTITEASLLEMTDAELAQQVQDCHAIASCLDEVFPSPTRDPIFNAGKTSRINVAGFMAQLIVNDELWNQWRGQMPVIYNADQ